MHETIGLILFLLSPAGCNAGPDDHCGAPEDCDSGLAFDFDPVAGSVAGYPCRLLS